MHSTHNEGNSVIAETFIRILKGKICKNMTPKDSKSCLGYLNNFVSEYNNTYHCSITNLFMMIILLCLKNLNRLKKLLTLKLVIEPGLLSTRRFSVKFT